MTQSAEQPALPKPTTRLKPWQRRAFLLVFSLLVAIVAIGLLEVGFRVAGYGGYPPTFRVAGTLDDGSTVILTDHAGPTSYFFKSRSLAGSLDPAAFISPKPAGTFRIFVVGESAAKGNPYPPPLAWSAFLQAMLTDAWPDRRVEVINLGTTAIASFPVLGLMTEALDYEPDLVIAYLGNNEFYGAYGVASLHSAGRSPAVMTTIRRVRSLAIAQFMDRHLISEAVGDPTTTLMETMVGRATIPPDDPARTAAAHNLEHFVGKMIDRCRARRVPIVVCTPPANERDLAPIGTPDLAALTADRRTELESALNAARASLASDPAAAEQAALRAVTVMPEHATAHYLLARARFAQLKPEAAADFAHAIDLDPMPWRPPSASVDSIRRAAANGNAPVCDLVAAFRAASPGGCIGWELMDDHVHASLAGQELIARSIVRTLATCQGAVNVPTAALDALPPRDDYLARLGDNPYDRYAAAWAMRRLASISFFRASNPEFFERNDRACREFEDAAPPGVRATLLQWQDPATHRSGVRPISGMVGQALLDMNLVRPAEPLLRVAAGSVPPYGSWDLQYTYLMLVARELAGGGRDASVRRDARAAIARGHVLIASGNSRSGGPELWMGLLHELCGEFKEAIPLLEAARTRVDESSRVSADEALAEAYHRTGRHADALAVIDAGIQRGGASVPAYQSLRQRILKKPVIQP